MAPENMEIDYMKPGVSDNVVNVHKVIYSFKPLYTAKLSPFLVTFLPQLKPLPYNKHCSFIKKYMRR
jgi:hypothetical protein